MATFGISSISGVYIESVDVEHKLETKVLVQSDGSFGEAMNYDPSFTFQLKEKAILLPGLELEADLRQTALPEW